MNKALWRSIHSLTHPISIFAVLLLLFNDHYLRHVSPSWMTGKLGDFTWLLFAPFIAGLLFALIIPRRVQNHERIVGFASIGFIGVWFATAKTIPFVHHITTSAFEWLVGWQGQLRLDVTDLLTLPALLISWYIWRTVPNTEINLKPYALIIFALAILGTLANSPSTRTIDNGIGCLHETNGVLYAITTGVGDFRYAEVIVENKQFISTDGGLTWEQTNDQIDVNCRVHSLPYNTLDWIFESYDGALSYRVIAGERVEIIEDVDPPFTSSIITTHDLSQYRLDLREVYYNHHVEDSSINNNSESQYLLSPVDAVVHSETGNLLLAMSLDGVLAITPDGEQTWVQIGEYRYIPLGDDDLISMINAVLVFAVFLFTLVGPTLYSQRWSWFATVIMFFWLIWLLMSLMFQPYGYGYLIIDGSSYIFVAMLSSLMTVILHFSMSVSVFRVKPRIIMSALLLSLAIALTYLLPYILWVEDRIPDFDRARLYAIGSTLICVYFAHRYIRKRYLPQLIDLIPEQSNRPYRTSDFDIDPTVNPFELEQTHDE